MTDFKASTMTQERFFASLDGLGLDLDQKIAVIKNAGDWVMSEIRSALDTNALVDTAREAIASWDAMAHLNKPYAVTMLIEAPKEDIAA